MHQVSYGRTQAASYVQKHCDADESLHVNDDHGEHAGHLH